jgi:hypothetical protein
VRSFALRTSWGANDQAPIDVTNALTNGEGLPLKIDIGPLQCKAFIDSKRAEGHQSNEHAIGFVVHCLDELFDLGREEDRALDLGALGQADGS